MTETRRKRMRLASRVEAALTESQQNLSARINDIIDAETIPHSRHQAAVRSLIDQPRPTVVEQPTGLGLTDGMQFRLLVVTTQLIISL